MAITAAISDGDEGGDGQDVSRGVAAHAAQETGLGDDTMKQMLPMVASLVMGALSKNMMGDQAATKGGGLSDILGQVLGGSGGAGSSGSSGGFGDILGQLVGGADAPKAGGSGGIGNIGDLLGGIGGSKAVDRPPPAAASRTSLAPSSATQPRPRFGREPRSAPGIPWARPSERARRRAPRATRCSTR